MLQYSFVLHKPTPPKIKRVKGLRQQLSKGLLQKSPITSSLSLFYTAVFRIYFYAHRSSKANFSIT